MQSRSVSHPADFTPTDEYPDSRRSPSPLTRLAFIAALAGFGFVALAVTTMVPTERSRHSVVAVAPAPLPADGADDYFPARFKIDDKAGDGGIQTYEH